MTASFRATPAVVAALLSCCCGTTPGAHDHRARRVRVDNPDRLAVVLYRAVRDGFEPLRELGHAPTIDLSLPGGRYALAVDAAAPSVPVPVPPEQLGYEAPELLVVTVLSPPDAAADFVWIPPGPALRGDDLGVGQEDERPVATPHTDGFWLAKHETTNAQYTAFLNARGRDAVDPSWLDLEGAKCRVQWRAQRSAFTTDAPDLPVVTVSWNGAVAYCDWLTETTGTKHRLPTETEWEKAARGPGSRVYAYGDTCRAAAANLESGRLRPVGRFAPNGFGLCDATGNAFEWCTDTYDPDAYRGGSSASRPGAAPDAQDAFRVLRGGSFVLDGIFCRNAMRMRLRPDVRADDVGFRVLREPASTPDKPRAGATRGHRVGSPPTNERTP